MKSSLLPLFLGSLLLVGCTDKKEPTAQAAETTDPMPSTAEVLEIDKAAEEAANAITEENAESALDALESELEAGSGDE